MNNGAFDGGQLTDDQRNLRNFYASLLNITAQSPALHDGAFQEVTDRPGFSNKQYAFLRTSSTQQLLIVLNFDHNQSLDAQLTLPNVAGKTIKDLLSGHSLVAGQANSIPVKVGAYDAAIYEIMR
jgi:glycosidase